MRGSVACALSMWMLCCGTTVRPDGGADGGEADGGKANGDGGCPGLTERECLQAAACLPDYSPTYEHECAAGLDRTYLGCRTLDLPVCSADVTIDDAQEALTLATAAWGCWAPYAATRQPVTPTLTARAALTLDGTTVAHPPFCASGGCAPGVRFVNDGSIAGVTSDAPEQTGRFVTSARLQVAAGARFRLRAQVADTHPWTYNFLALVFVMPPCMATCEPSARHCISDGVCYATGEAYCRHCQNAPLTRCACLDQAGGPLAEGAACSFFESGDSNLLGTCQAGDCKQR